VRRKKSPLNPAPRLEAQRRFARAELRVANGRHYLFFWWKALGAQSFHNQFGTAALSPLLLCPMIAFASGKSSPKGQGQKGRSDYIFLFCGRILFLVATGKSPRATVVLPLRCDEVAHVF
jgi:hypothetical protein